MKHTFQQKDSADGSHGILNLWGELTIEYAVAIKDVFVEVLAKVDRIDLFLNDVDVVDVSFLQLLCSFHRECFHQGKQLSVQGEPEDSLVDILYSRGFGRQIGCKGDALRTCCLKKICRQ
ncbi:STAS domain-containing protein [Desulfogranum japonicum]|uniref:STAS domain-containing protein n=1 Tax=Desulfogranum japonicum TaxID=231447 RepID=UPI0004034468|nr:STAS domain-containing protein [Desulfogranum japonicum]